VERLIETTAYCFNLVLEHFEELLVDLRDEVKQLGVLRGELLLGLLPISVKLAEGEVAERIPPIA